jgi:hypothetical protein
LSRLISVDSTGTQRSRLRRTIAEALRRLMEKKTLDDEAKDLASLIVFCLREISAGIDQSARAWEKRDYYMKADRFRREWEWVDRAAHELEQALRASQWGRLPDLLAGLLPRFSDVKVSRLVRPASLWAGCYQRLLATEREYVTR